jgi:hypothetical protein
MNILDVIANAQGGAAVQQLGSQFGLASDEARSALEALMPALAAGLHRNASSEDGLDDLMSTLAQGRHAQYLENPGSLASAAATRDGNSIHAHVLGSKDASIQVAQHAAREAGITASTLQRMLPLVAAMTMGGLSQKHAAGAGANFSSRESGGGAHSPLTPMLDGQLRTARSGTRDEMGRPPAVAAI